MAVVSGGMLTVGLRSQHLRISSPPGITFTAASSMILSLRG
jgi:hypothetical protein